MMFSIQQAPFQPQSSTPTNPRGAESTLAALNTTDCPASIADASFRNTSLHSEASEIDWELINTHTSAGGETSFYLIPESDSAVTEPEQPTINHEQPEATGPSVTHDSPEAPEIEPAAPAATSSAEALKIEIESNTVTPPAYTKAFLSDLSERVLTQLNSETLKSLLPKKFTELSFSIASMKTLMRGSVFFGFVALSFYRNMYGTNQSQGDKHSGISLFHYEF